MMLMNLAILLVTQTIVLDRIQSFGTTPECFKRPSSTECVIFPARSAKDYRVRARANSGRIRCCWSASRTKNLRNLTAHPNNPGTDWCFSLDSASPSTDTVQPILWPHMRRDVVRVCASQSSDGSIDTFGSCVVNADCEAGVQCVNADQTQAQKVGAILLCETPSGSTNLRVQVQTP